MIALIVGCVLSATSIAMANAPRGHSEITYQSIEYIDNHSNDYDSFDTAPFSPSPLIFYTFPFLSLAVILIALLSIDTPVKITLLLIFLYCISGLALLNNDIFS